MVKQISDNEIYLLIKYIKSLLWRISKSLSYTEDARCLKVKAIFSGRYHIYSPSLIAKDQDSDLYKIANLRYTQIAILYLKLPIFPEDIQICIMPSFLYFYNAIFSVPKRISEYGFIRTSLMQIV